jgi:hypothetical protein
MNGRGFTHGQHSLTVTHDLHTHTCRAGFNPQTDKQGSTPSGQLCHIGEFDLSKLWRSRDWATLEKKALAIRRCLEFQTGVEMTTSGAVAPRHLLADRPGPSSLGDVTTALRQAKEEYERQDNAREAEKRLKWEAEHVEGRYSTPGR